MYSKRFGKNEGHDEVKKCGIGYKHPSRISVVSDKRNLSMPNNNWSCLIELRDDELLVANSGQPFSRLSVVAICASHLGTKHDYRPTDPDPRGSDDGLISSIRQREIKTYRTNPDRITSDFRGEEETRLDYGGRAIWELLQNADDAMAPSDLPPSRLIGTKGIGFKSVLEITDEPEVHSGPFHFQFSIKKNTSLLRKMGLSRNPPPLTFRIPFEKEPNKKLINLLEKYSTVIRLPLREGMGERVHSWLNELDPRILLFCQYIQELKIVSGHDIEKKWKLNRGDIGELVDCEMSLKVTKDTDSEPKPFRFHRWAKTWDSEGQDKHLSVSICLPLDENDDPISDDFSPPLHVFFPTKEKLPFYALMHASFDLEQNRKRIRKGKHDEQILSELGALLKRMANEKVPASTILKAFVPKTDNISKEQDLGGRIWEKFKEVLQKEAFIPVIGGHHASPLECYRWKFNIGKIIDHSAEYIQNLNLVVPEIQEDKHCQEALSILESNELGLNDYQNLLRYCLNNTKGQCKETLSSLFQIVKHCMPPYHIERGIKQKNFLNKCREVNCWWNQDAIPRSLKSTIPLFKSTPKEDIPESLPLDYLDKEFLKITESMIEEENSSFKDLLNGFLRDSTNDDFLHFCLIPAIERKDDKLWWEQNGHDVLSLYKIWVPQSKGIEPIWEDHNRIRLGKALRLPTDKGWMPADLCYAGNEWAGPNIFDQFFKDVPDRGILLPLDKWPQPHNEDNIDSWKNKLKYAGVSWEIKLIKWEVEIDRGWTIGGNIGKWEIKCPFKSGIKDDHWIEYCNQLDPPKYAKAKTFDWEATVNKQWAIDYFPDALPLETEDRLRILRPISEKALESQMRYTHEKTGYWGRTYEKNLLSFAYWQLMKFPWLLCKPSLFYTDRVIPPERAYMPGKGLNGLLPEVDIQIPKGQEGRDLETFLTQALKVQEKLPNHDSISWKEWIEELPVAVQRVTYDQSLKKMVRSFFKALFSLSTQPKDFHRSIKVPSLRLLQDQVSGDEFEDLSFKSPKEVFWLDKHYFAEPATRLELMRKFNIFLLELEQGRKAEEWINIQRLSDSVAISSEYELEDNSLKDKLIACYMDRHTALQVIDEQIKLPAPSNLNLKVVRNLKLAITASGSRIATPIVTSWKKGDILLVDDGDPWHGFGRGLTSHNKRRLSDTFENILKARSSKEVLERLREHGIPEATLDDLKVSMSEDQLTQRVVEPVEHSGPTVDEPTEEGPVTAKGKGGAEDLLKDTPTKIAGDDSVPSIDMDQDGLGPHDGGVSPQVQGQVTVVESIITQARGEKGKEAEEWIKKRLKERLGEMWYVSGRERDAKGRESDIVLRSKQLGVFHIEVKHMESESIYWSQKEVEKAHIHHNRYFMVVCIPTSENQTDNPYREYWLIDPISNLSNFERSGYWLWQGKEQIKELPDGWDIPKDKPFKEATNFHFHIKIPEQELKDKAVGSFEDVKQIMENNQ